ncbi:MAG: hypothetical protein JXA82_00540 [Sedimentisphaerales bacterium]|nr:hypothetical protein [Sedimentisphaerales bacterium]
MDYLWMVLAVFLFIASGALLVLEVFIPSFGLLTICALACLGGGIAIFFQFGTVAGWLGVGISVVLIPIICWIVYVVFPHTSIGKGVILSDRLGKNPGDGIPDNQQRIQMLNMQGTVITALRPVGTCDFDGNRVECVSETGFIEKGKSIKVIRVEGPQITVRLIEEKENEL